MAARRCEQMAKRGTGTGVCDAPLDEHGQCGNAGNHTDEFQGERQPIGRKPETTKGARRTWDKQPFTTGARRRRQEQQRRDR